MMFLSVWFSQKNKATKLIINIQFPHIPFKKRIKQTKESNYEKK